MSNERKLRLNQVARQLNVGLNTIIDFLDKKGIKVESSPSSFIDAKALDILEKEFGGGRVESVNIRERIGLKHETVSLDSRKEDEEPIEPQESKEEPVKATNVITAKEEVAARTAPPKILGKMDLDKVGKPTPKPTPKASAPSEPVAPSAPSEPVAPSAPSEPVAVKQSAALSSAQPPVPKGVVPAAPIEATRAVSQTTPVSPKVNTPKAAEAVVPEKKTPQTPAAKVVAVQPIQEMANEAAQQQTFDQRQAADGSNLFRPSADGNKLSGPKVVGKMDVQAFEKKGDGAKREKRKRITKDKVDVNKNQPAAQQGQTPRTGAPRTGAPGAGGAGTRRKTTGKPAPRPVSRPVVRAAVSDEDVQKQIKDTLARLTSKGSKFKSSKYRKDKREAVSARISEEHEREEQEKSILRITEFVSVSELASMMNAQVTDVITACMNLGLMVSINQRLDAEALVVVAEEFGYKVEFVTVDTQEAIDEEEDKEEDLTARPPIVTVMGHVDHGKTSLLDNIRMADVTSGEAGGITQHIGAYSVKVKDQRMTFLDTPGHEAFTAMRARGAKVTDVAIIIVAADDSVMPQTVEAINHAAAAGVPIVFAINKIDKATANPEKIKEQLASMNYQVEDWGGKFQSQEVSAKQGLNLDKLLEKVLLEAEFLHLKANPQRKAQGVIIESTLDKGRGYVATVLVQNGTLHVGDVMLSGTYSGRVKAMFNERGQRIESAPPSTPVLVLGLSGAPQAGDSFNVVDDDRTARDIANKREQLQRMQGLRAQKHITLDEIGRRIAIGNFKELNIIVKGDVDGSIEALSDSLIKLSKEEVLVNVIHKAVGPISESDVLLAAASNAVIVGFQVRPSATSRKLAEKEEIEIRLYSIIYDAINDIKDAIDGMLAPVMKEEIVCSVEVMETFKITKVGTVAGCLVREGKITRNTPIRVIRDGIVIYTGKLGSLKRFKDDMKEVTNGMECGLNVENYNDIKVGDFIEGYEQVEVKRK